MKAQDFWHIYHAIYPRRWLLAALLGATLSLVAAVCAGTPRYYRASAYVMPSETALTKPLIPGAGAALSASARSGDRRLEEQMATLIGLAKTGEVRQRAIETLHLTVSPSQLEQMVSAEPGEGNIIRISALAKSPEGAVSLANAVAHQFTGYYRDISSYQARQNRRFLDSEWRAAGREMEVAKEELRALKSREGDAALPVGTAENPFLTQYYLLRTQIDDARSQLDEVQGRLAGTRHQLQAQSRTKRTEVSTTENPEADRLETERSQAEADLAQALTKYTEKHRVVTDLKAKIAGLNKRLDAARRVITKETIAANPLYERLTDDIPALETERQALRAKLSALQTAMAENERRAARLADSSVLLAAKTADYESAKTRHDFLKQMLDSAVLEERVSSSRGGIQVVDPAKSATGPVTKGGPTLAQLVLLGLFLSVGLSFGTVTALAFLDSRVQERQDLQRELGLPVPAVVPIGAPTSEANPLARVTELDPTSAQAEAYRYLRAQLLYQKGGTQVRTVLIATARPAQGGTTTAANLALALAEVGQRVVLVDGDLRRPSLHRFFGLTNDYGLTDLLRGDGDYARALRSTDVPSLRVLPAGSPTSNPAALLNSAAMGQLLATLREEADFVVIDGPSLGAFADSMMLGPLVDGVILVARAGQSLGHVEQQAKEMLERVGANIVGAVLNAAAPDKVSNWYFHQHYYGAPATPPAAPTAASGAPAAAPAPGRWEGARRVARHLLLGLLAVAIGAALWVGTHPRRPAVTPPRAAAAPDARAAARPSAVKVVADVRQPTRVRVTRDGEVLYEGPLAVGQQLWQADRELEVWAEHPEAVFLTVNGREGAALGDAGSPTSRRFTADEGAEH